MDTRWGRGPVLERLACGCQWYDYVSSFNFYDVLSALYCSKDGAAQVKLKLALKNDEPGHNFIFVSNNALQERDKFKRELTAVIGKNRTAETGKTTATSSPSQSRTELLKQRSATNTPGLTSRPSQEGTLSRRGSATPQAAGFAPEDYRLCKKVLIKNAELAALHKQLVISGQISEVEFWEGRQVRTFSWDDIL